MGAAKSQTRRAAARMRRAAKSARRASYTAVTRLRFPPANHQLASISAALSVPSMSRIGGNIITLPHGAAKAAPRMARCAVYKRRAARLPARLPRRAARSARVRWRAQQRRGEMA